MMHETGARCAYLDISHKPADWIRTRFPGIYAKCKEVGIDITSQPIPVVPAAHYTCGGVVTSLLECLVWGVRAGEDAARAVRSGDDFYLPEIAPWQYETEAVDPALVAQDWLTIRQTMWNYVGLVRTRKRLDRAQQILRELHLEVGRFYARSELNDGLIGLRNGIQAALVVLLAATEARESRGCHYRTD